MSEQRVQCRLAADMAGLSRLIGLDEEGTLARLKALLHQQAGQMTASDDCSTPKKISCGAGAIHT